METSYAPINRSAYQLAAEATDAYEGARKAAQRFINAPHAHELIFTKNATEGLNLVAYSWGRANLQQGDVVVLTQMEHHANIVPWHMLAAERGIELRWVPLTIDGLLDLTNLDTLLDGRQGVLLHGDEQRARHHHAGSPAVRCGTRRRRVGDRRRLPVRAAQRHRRAGVGRRLRRVQQPQDVRAIGHRRAVGPRGAARRDAAVPRRWQHDPRRSPRRVHARRAARQVRGRHAADRRGDRAARRDRLPRGPRHGQRSPSRDGHRHVRDDTLNERYGDDICLHGPTNVEVRGATFSFGFRNIHPHDLSQVLDQRNICLRAGHHCAKPLMRLLGVNATARASFYLYNDDNDVDALADALDGASDIFGL